MTKENEHIAVMGNTSSGMSKTIKHKFECAPFLRLKQEELIKSDYFYKKALKTDLTKKYYIDDIMYRCNHEDNVIISKYGETGSGKSEASLATAWLIAKTFNSKIYICFLAEEVFEALKKCKRHDVVLLDEWTPKSQFGVGSGREYAQLAQIEDTIRKRQIHLMYCAPNLYHHQHKMVIRMWDISRTTNTSRGIMENDEGHPYGYVLFGRAPEKLRKEYEIAKETFLDKIQAMDFGREENTDKWVDKIIHSDEWMNAIQNKAKKAVLIEIIKDMTPQLTTREYEIILARIELRKLKFKQEREKEREFNAKEEE